MDASETLTTLEVLLLSFVRNGLGTAYDLLAQAGMSVGLSGQAFQRLEKLQSITATAGPRNRKLYTITKKGEKELRAALTPGKSRSTWFARFGVFDSAPRAMFLAWLYSDQNIGEGHLNWSIEELKNRSRDKDQEAENQLRDIYRLRSTAPEDETPEVGPIIAKTYRLMKAVSDAALLKAQIDVLERVGPIFLTFPPATLPRNKFLQSLEGIAGNLGFRLEKAAPASQKSSRARR